MNADYQSWIENKLNSKPPIGLVDVPNLDAYPLFPHQRDLVAWALKRGRCAIFADTGLGKTRMEIVWSHIISQHIKKPVVILTPLAVAAQHVAEALEIGIESRVCREAEDVGPGINVINYDRLHKLDTSVFGGVTLDESSIIKHHDAKTFSILTEAFKHTPFRLAATATPAPNDWTELGTHAEFLGICSRTEMLSEWFTHDGAETQVWRLKKHARKLFWKWVCSWAALIRKPSDLGYDDGPYNLPPIHVHEHKVESRVVLDGFLFAMQAQTLQERRNARRGSIDDRINECRAVVASTPQDEPWVIWCDLNAESEKLTQEIDGAHQITGSDDSDDKEKSLERFSNGSISRLVSKPSICGWGLNWQHCNHMAFVGVTDSWEAYYQAVRRCWRFGQKKPVHVHIFASESEGAIVANLKRKEADAIAMADALSAETLQAMRESIGCSTRSTNNYNPKQTLQTPSFL